jgi:hypothetical protein
MTLRNCNTEKKLRGIPRRIRSLKKWALSFENYFPKELVPTERYYNWKIPVIRSLVEGKQSNIELKSMCAQQLINAAYFLYLSKPEGALSYRVTCCVMLPEMFSSELCIFTSEEYFQEHTNKGTNSFGEISIISNKSLANEMGLVLPIGFHELGVLRTYIDEGVVYRSECWYFGEVI